MVMILSVILSLITIQINIIFFKIVLIVNILNISWLYSYDMLV